MTHHYTKITFFVALFFAFLVSAKFLIFDVSVTSPNLNSLCVGGDYQNLGDIVITEANNNDFTATTSGNFLRLQIVGNFQFEPGVGTVSVASGGGEDLSNASITVSTNQIVVFYDATAPNHNDVMTISGLRVRATTTAGGGSIQMTAGAAIAGITLSSTNLATFTSVAAPNVSLTDSDADNIICSGTSVTFTASGASTYQFKINGNNVVNGVDGTISGTNGEVFTTTTLTNGDVVSVVGTSGGCSATATSTSFTVNSSPFVALSSDPSSASICSGSNITFTATSNGTNFVFYRNGAPQQSGVSKTWSTTSLSNGDVVRVDASFGGSCSVQSNQIAVTVNPIPNVGFIEPPDTDFPDNYGYAVFLSNGVTYGGTLNSAVLPTNQGVYSGPGVIGNRFYPIVAGAGNHTILFTYTTPSGCSNSSSIVMRVTTAFATVNNLNPSYCENSGFQPANAPFLTPRSITYTYITGRTCTLSPTATVTMDSYRFLQAEYGPTSSVVFVTGTPVNTYRLNINNYPVNIDYDYIRSTGTYNCTGDCSDYGMAVGPVVRTFYQAFSIASNPILAFTGFTDGQAFCPDVGTQINLGVTDNGVSILGSAALTYEISETNAFTGFSTLTAGFTPATGIINLADPYFTSSTAPKDFWLRISYTNASNCSATTSARRFRINPIPQPNFTGLNAFYCEGSATDVLTMTNGISEPFNYSPFVSSFNVRDASNNFLFTITANAFNQFQANFNSLTSGNYTVTARYRSLSTGCVAESAPQPFEIRPLPTLTFTGLQPQYCSNVASTLLQGQSGGIDVFTGTFEVSRTFPTASGWEVLTGNRFSPQQPLPSQPPVQYSFDTGYEIRFTYTNASGCTSQIIQSTVVKALPVLDFDFPISNPTGVICRDANSITLNPSVSPGPMIPANGRFLIERTQPLPTTPLTNPFTMATGVNTIDFGSSQFSIPTNTNDVYVYNIAYIYTDGNGCSDTSAIKTLTVNPSPTVAVGDIDITNRCLGDVTQFTVNYSRPISSYEWAGTEIANTITTANTFSVSYTTTGVKNINLTITNPEGCKQTVPFSIEIKAKPQPDFTFLGQCLGSPTQFTDQTQIVGNGDPIVAWAWDFGDSNTSTQPSPQHIYMAAGTYNVSLTVQTSIDPDLSCPVTISKQVVIFGQNSPTTANPYIENFNASNGGWITGQTTATLSSWQWGNQTTVHNKIRPKDGAYWRTFMGATSTDTIQYKSNEQSFLESPCFDLTNLDRPAINFDYWSDTRLGQDGIAVLYSINDGVSWSVLGNVNQGVEWYNAAGITGLPGSSSPGLANGSVNGWSGNTQTDWKTARFVLDNVKNLAGVGGRTRFRIVFGSLPLGPGSYDGFAIDNVQISSRNRKILLEHFTNAGAPEVGAEDSFINNIANTQTESIDIRYHASFPNPDDPLNEDNTADPSARALFYGVSQIPRTTRDGEIFAAKYSTIDPLLIEYQKRSLKPSPFEISISFGNNPVELLNIGANIRAVEDFNRPIIVRMAVIEKQIDGNTIGLTGSNFRNVVKRLVPDAAGTRVNVNWIKNVTQANVNQSYNPIGFYDKNQMAVVVFIQDETTKEIYQAAYAEPTTIPGGITAIEDALNDQIYLYPNPAKDKVYLKTQNLGKLTYQVYDGLGKIIAEGEFNGETYELDTQKYAGGLYMIRLMDSNGNMGNKKLIITR